MNGAMESHEASALILRAIDDAAEIQAAGKQSLLAIAARALDPAAPATRVGITATLGLHDTLVCAVLVAADVAGDTLSRRELARRLFPALPLRPHRPPRLTAEGQRAVVGHCLEAAHAIDELMGGLLGELARALAAPAPAALDALEAHAVELQRTKVVAIERNEKSKLGVPVEEAIRRRAAQAVRATVQGLRERPQSPHLAPTVAGELAAAVALAGGPEAGLAFLLSLARFLEGLPPTAAERPPGNGG